MHSGSPTPHKKARIEIIPLIDIMFFLLASFMLVSLSLVKLQGAKVDLPPAGKPITDQQTKPEFVTVSLDKTGHLIWANAATKGKEILGVDELTQHAKALFAQNKESKVFVNGDGDVPYGDVLAVMDRLRRSGLTKVTFATKAYVGAPPGAAAPAPGAAPAAAPAAPAPAPPGP